MQQAIQHVKGFGASGRIWARQQREHFEYYITARSQFLNPVVFYIVRADVRIKRDNITARLQFLNPVVFYIVRADVRVKRDKHRAHFRGGVSKRRVE